MRTALHLSLLDLEKIFPGTSPTALLDALRPGAIRRRLLRHRLLDDPVEFMDEDHSSLSRYPARLLLTDRMSDALALSLQVLARPIVRPLLRLLGKSRPPWEWA